MVGKARRIVVWLLMCCVLAGVLPERADAYEKQERTGTRWQLSGKEPMRLLSEIMDGQLTDKAAVPKMGEPEVGPTNEPGELQPDVPGVLPTNVPAGQPTEVPGIQPVEPPVETPETPAASFRPSAPPSSPLVLKNPGAKLSKGGQKGIGYGKVNKQKIYHINAYALSLIHI